MSLPHAEWLEWLLALATPLGLQMSLVGGVVRDQLLGRALPLKDLDLVLEGPMAWPALVLAEAIVNAAATSQLPLGYQLLQCTPHSNYGTARLQLQTNGGFLLCDLSSAADRYPIGEAIEVISLAELGGLINNFTAINLLS
ncbi:MAG: hypothetical protein EBX33_09415 [Synechococcaceae bacterium WB8_1A_041]|nr:hypothetical protein [Synechococcaceae bacterium WB8_1A_041]